MISNIFLILNQSMTLRPLLGPIYDVHAINIKRVQIMISVKKGLKARDLTG